MGWSRGYYEVTPGMSCGPDTLSKTYKLNALDSMRSLLEERMSEGNVLVVQERGQVMIKL